MSMNEFQDENIPTFRLRFIVFNYLTFHCGHLPFLVYAVIFNITKLLLFCSVLITFVSFGKNLVCVVCYAYVREEKNTTLHMSNLVIEAFLRKIGTRRKDGIEIEGKGLSLSFPNGLFIC